MRQRIQEEVDTLRSDAPVNSNWISFYCCNSIFVSSLNLLFQTRNILGRAVLVHGVIAAHMQRAIACAVFKGIQEKLSTTRGFASK